MAGGSAGWIEHHVRLARLTDGIDASDTCQKKWLK